MRRPGENEKQKENQNENINFRLGLLCSDALRCVSMHSIIPHLYEVIEFPHSRPVISSVLRSGRKSIFNAALRPALK